MSSSQISDETYITLLTFGFLIVDIPQEKKKNIKMSGGLSLPLEFTGKNVEFWASNKGGKELLPQEEIVFAGDGLIPARDIQEFQV